MIMKQPVIFFSAQKHISIKCVLNVHGIKRTAMEIKLPEDFLARYFWVMLRDSVCDHAAVV